MLFVRVKIALGIFFTFPSQYYPGDYLPIETAVNAVNGVHVPVVESAIFRKPSVVCWSNVKSMQSQ